MIGLYAEIGNFVKINGKFVLRAIFILIMLCCIGPLSAYQQHTVVKGISVRGITQDSAGMMWLSTPEGYYSYDGYNIRKYTAPRAEFRSVPYEEILSAVEFPEGLSHISGVVKGESPEIVYVGTWYSLVKYNIVTRTIERNVPLPVVKIMLADEGRIWLGTDNGLYIYENDNLHRYVHDAYKPTSSLASNVVWSLYKDMDGNIWVGTDNGVTILMAEKGLIRYNLADITGSHDGNRITNLLTDSRGRLWLGGSDGLICISNFGSDSQTSRWFRMDSPSSPLRHNRVRAIAEDSRGRLFVGGDGGLMMFNESTSLFELVPINKDHHDWIYNIIPTDSDIIVVDDLNTRYFLDTEKLTVSDTCKRERNDNSVITDVSGRKWFRDTLTGKLWTGGDDSFMLTDEAVLHRQLAGKRVTFTGLTVNGQPGDSILDMKTDEVTLSNDENNLVLYFSDFTYSVERMANYCYRINGGDWIPLIGRRNEIHLTKLSPGKYRVEVAPSVNDVVDESKSNSLNVVISVPWYKSTGMMIAYILLALLVVSTIIIVIVQRRILLYERHNSDQALQLAKRKEESLQKELVETARGNDTALRPSENDSFLLRVTQLIEDNMDNPELSPAVLSELAGISHKQLYRQIKRLTGMTVVEYIRTRRMQQAGDLLSQGNFTVAEVMYRVGFTNASYFSRSFLSYYGVSPRNYAITAD